MAGCLVDLDEHKSALVSFQITDDFTEVCRIIKVEMFSNKQLIFSDDETTWFSFGGSDWCPVAIKETTDGVNFGYEIKAVPRNAIKVVKTKITNTKDIANIIGASLSGTSISVPSNLTNLNVINLCRQCRNQSILMNTNDIGKALFIYFDSVCLVSKTFNSLFNEKADVYKNTSNFSENITFFDSRNERYHEADGIKPNNMTPKQILLSHVGRTISIQSTRSASLFKTYTISVGKRDLPNMVCTKIQVDSKMKPQVYVNTFSEIL